MIPRSAVPPTSGTFLRARGPAVRRRLFRAAAGLLFWFPAAAAAREDGDVAKEEEMFQSASQLYETSQDKTAAIEAFERFLQRFSDSPRAADAQFMIGEASMRQALTILRAEATAKKASEARLMAPRNAAALQALRDARSAFRQVADRRRRSGLAPSAQYRLGEVAYDEKDWNAAIEEFRQVEKSYPKSYLVPESWMGIVFAYLALEQFSQAESNLFMLGESYPNYLKMTDVLYAQGIIALHKGDYAGAEKAFKQVPTAEAQFYLGKTYLLSKRPFLAATAFERLVRDYPASELKEEAEFFIGDSFFLAKDYDGAITKYQRFLEKYLDSRLRVAALFRIGSSQFQKKTYVDARANFQSVIDRYPQDFFAPLAQYFIAESHLVANQMRDGLFAYTKVITQFPETIKISPLAHYKLAWTQHQVGDWSQATQTCQNFLALYPTHALAKNVHLILGNALMALKRYPEAVTAWQRIIDLAPTSDIAEQALFSILQAQHNLKNFNSILTSYQFIFRHLPPSQSKWRSLSYLYAAEAYLALNQVDEAQTIYEMILKVYPNDPAAFYAQDGLAWCYAHKGEDTQALEERQKLKEMMSLARSSFTFSGHNELGIADSMFNQKNFEDAYQLYDKFVRENPDAREAPSALYRAGMSLYHLRYYTQAIETWQRLQANYPKSPETQQAVSQIADTLFRAQKYPEAVAAYKGIIEKYPKSPQLASAFLRLAQAAFNMKDDAGAVRDAASLITRFPKSQEAMDALDLMEDVFDRSPGVDFEASLRLVVGALPHTLVGGEAQFRLARRFYNRKEYQRAATEFQGFSVDFTDNPQLPKAQFLLAEALFNGGKYAEAVPAYQRYLNNFPRSEDTPLTLFHLGSAHYNLKEYAPATAQYQRLVEEYPDSEYAKTTQFNLALAYKAAGKLDSAQEAYSRYVRSSGGQDPNAQTALWEVFGMQKDRKDYASALDTLAQIQAAAGSNTETLLEAAYHVGELYSVMGRQEEALQQWEKLRELKPAGNPFRLQALIKLGDAYEKTDPPRAIPVYEDLARNANTPQLAQSARERASGLRGKFGSAKPLAGRRAAPGPKLPGQGQNAGPSVDELHKTQVMPGEEEAVETPRAAPANKPPKAKPKAKKKTVEKEP